MNTPHRLLVLTGTLQVALGLLAADPPLLDPHLEPLRPWLGKTWKGEFKNSKPDKPTVDIARWERALNGKPSAFCTRLMRELTAANPL